MTECDHDYFLRRASEEGDAAERAAHPLARRRHLDLAQRYDRAAVAASGQVIELRLMHRA